MQGRRSWRRATPLMLLALCLLPVLAAGLLYLSGYHPRIRVNHGELLDPPPSLHKLHLTGLQPPSPAPSVWENKWSLVWLTEPPCSIPCLSRLEEMLGIQVGLRKSALRVQRVVILTALDGGTEFARSIREHRDLTAVMPKNEDALRELRSAFGYSARAPRGLYVVDPRGRLVLRYHPDAAPADVLEDMKRLLRYSWIG